MIVRFRSCAAVAVASSALLLLAGGCSKPPAPAVTQPAVQLDSQETSDVDVTTGVKAALLRDSALKSFDIAVMTTKGDVRLTGQVDNQSQIDSALVIARGIKGVHSIHDELTVKK
jgi:hyperosmotically inducible protein